MSAFFLLLFDSFVDLVKTFVNPAKTFVDIFKIHGESFLDCVDWIQDGLTSEQFAALPGGTKEVEAIIS